MVDTCFVVLHYLTYEKTKQCVQSLLALQGSSACAVVVVDNASNNGSFEKLCEDFGATDSVYLLHHERNEGFARGMNSGYQYAREKLNAKIIGVLNNDLRIEQQDFLALLNSVQRNGADVIGPDIVDVNSGQHTNPQVPPQNYWKELWRYRAIYLFFRIVPESLSFRLFSQAKKNLLTSSNDENREYANTLALQPHNNVQLHGAAIFFANRFVQEESICFDPRTFLYHEEDLLFQYCMRKGYNIEYVPALHVVHDSEASTKAETTDMRVRKLHRLLHQMHSVKFVIEAIHTYGLYKPTYNYKR